jgi:hypothetical protein
MLNVGGFIFGRGGGQCGSPDEYNGFVTLVNMLDGRTGRTVPTNLSMSADMIPTGFWK